MDAIKACAVESIYRILSASNLSIDELTSTINSDEFKSAAARESASTPSGAWGATNADYDSPEGGILRAYDNMRRAQKERRERLDAEKKSKRKSARRYEDSIEATAKDAYAEILEKDVLKASIEGLFGLTWRYMVIPRNEKGFGAFYKRLVKMNLIDARDRIDLTDARVLNVLARTRGVKSWVEKGRIDFEGMDGADVASEMNYKIINQNGIIAALYAKQEQKQEREKARAKRAAEKSAKEAKKTALQAQKRMKELLKDANTCLYVEQILKAHKDSTLVITA